MVFLVNLYDMNLALIAAMNFMLNGFKKETPKGEPSEEFKKEIEKVNEMGLFESLEYAKKYYESVNNESKK